MVKNSKIDVKGTEITILKSENDDFISLTDIARHKDAENTDDIIKNWMRHRSTIELLGFWEMRYNSNLKPVEFEGFTQR
jgi:hypothetical protein